MSAVLDVISNIFLALGVAFFVAGTVGILRFPDLHSRLHALSKADNLGLGLVSLGLIARTDDFAVAVKIFLIWLLALLASAVTCFAIAEWNLERGHEG